MINGWILLIDCFGFEDVYAVTSCTIRASARLIDDAAVLFTASGPTCWFLWYEREFWEKT